MPSCCWLVLCQHGVPSVPRRDEAIRVPRDDGQHRHDGRNESTLVQLQAGPELETDTVRNISANRGRKYGQHCLLSSVLRSFAGSCRERLSALVAWHQQLAKRTRRARRVCTHCACTLCSYYGTPPTTVHTQRYKSTQLPHKKTQVQPTSTVQVRRCDTGLTVLLCNYVTYTTIFYSNHRKHHLKPSQTNRPCPSRRSVERWPAVSPPPRC